MVNMKPVFNFLGALTPVDWVYQALDQIPVLLIDHANCEKKAAGTALNLMFRYVEKVELLNKMSQLAREELLHFEQVLALMQERNVQYRHLSASNYAAGLHQHIRREEPHRLIDTLIIGAFIEARSCERFYALAEEIDNRDNAPDSMKALSGYYRFLLKSESRHFMDYIELARLYDHSGRLDERVGVFRDIESRLVNAVQGGPLRFHSGPVKTSVEA